MSDVSSNPVSAHAGMVVDSENRVIRLVTVDDFRVAAKTLAFEAKEKGRPALKPFAEMLLLNNWTIQPTEFFSNATALGTKVIRVAKEKTAETVWTVNYRKVHANGGTGPVQTATVTMAEVRKFTGEKAGRIGPKRVMIALAAKLETTLDKLTTAGHTFATAQGDDITTAMLSGTVSEVDQTPTVPDVKPDAEEKADSADESETRAAVLESV